MAYCTLAQLTDRYGERALVDLTDRAEQGIGEIDGDVVTRAIADADAAIDGYLKGRYLLPLAAVPALVTDLSLTVAYYRLHIHTAPEKVRRDYEDAMRTLRDIAAGAIRLDVAGAEPTSSGASGVQTTDRERDMTPANLKGFV